MKKESPIKQMLLYVFIQTLINWIIGLGDLCQGATLLAYLFAIGPWSIGVIVLTSIMIKGEGLNDFWDQLGLLCFSTGAFIVIAFITDLLLSIENCEIFYVGKIWADLYGFSPTNVLKFAYGLVCQICESVNFLNLVYSVGIGYKLSQSES